MLTRREILAMLAAAPAAAQLPQLARRGGPQRVIVIGGGLAGLCAAYELQQQGHTAIVLEAQTRPGGRVRTLRDFAPGLFTEAGPESIPAIHEITQHYVRLFGLNLLPFTNTAMRAFSHVKGRRIVPDANTVWPFEFTEEEKRLGAAGLRKKYFDPVIEEAQAAGWSTNPAKALASLDPHTAGTWLRSRGASPAAAEYLTLGFGTESGSAAFVLHALHTRGGTGPGYRVEGGNDRFPVEFARRVDIRYGTPVLDVRQDDLGVRVTTSAGTLDADRAVCALPCPVIGRIFDSARLSEAKQKAIREQNYSHTVKVFLQARNRFWLKLGFSGFVTTDLPVERTTPDPGTDPDARGALAAYQIGAFALTLEKMSEEDRVAAAYAQVRQLFPELAGVYEGGISKAWGIDPWQKGSFALHTPGQIGYIEILARREGRIHFAGEHTSAWTGWMQGALESARRVVGEVNG
jgi:monoamine oxidase